MLVFDNVAMFEAIYDSAKKTYPELVDTIITVGYTETKAGVLLLEGTEEDAGKYKIAISPSGDEKVLASFFMGGLAMLIHKLRHNTYVHPASQDVEFKPDDEYKQIFATIVKAFETVPYGGEYAHE
jgi:hypothetical protein